MMMFYSQTTRKKKTNKDKSDTYLMVAKIFQYFLLFFPMPLLLAASIARIKFLFIGVFFIITIGGSLVISFILVSFYYNWRAKNHPEEDMETELDQGMDDASRKIKAYTILYPHIKLSTLAKKSGSNESEIEDKLLNLMVHREIVGHIDPGTNQFISGLVDHSIIVDGSEGPDAFLCPFCKSSIGSPPVKGTTLKCDSCGNLIVM